MKFFQSFLAVATFLVLTEAQFFTRPDGVIKFLRDQETKVTKYQNETMIKIQKLRGSVGTAVSTSYNEGLAIGVERFKKIGYSDKDIRAKILNQTQNPCWESLLRQVNETIIYSGFHFANCLDIPEDCAIKLPIHQDLERLEREVRILPKILIDSVYGRNVFTQPQDIINAGKKKFDDKKKLIENLFDLVQNSTSLENEWKSVKKEIVKCYDKTDTKAANAYAEIKSRFDTCSSFGPAGRSIQVIDISEFFYDD